VLHESLFVAVPGATNMIPTSRLLASSQLKLCCVLALSGVTRHSKQIMSWPQACISYHGLSSKSYLAIHVIASRQVCLAASAF
jgi:hypothetical protein